MKTRSLVALFLLLPWLLFSFYLTATSMGFLKEAKDLYYQGQLEEALDLYVIFMEEEGEPTLYFDKAIIHLELKEDERALELLYHLISLEPQESRWYRELGIFYTNRGQYHKAISPLKRSLSLAPHRESYYYLGLALKGTGDIQGAIDSFGEVLALFPSFALAYYQLALIYDYNQELHKAINHYLLALRYDPSMTDIHTLLGERYLELRDFTLAYEHFLRAVMVTPNPLNQARLKEMQERFPDLVEKDERIPTQLDISWRKPAESPSPEGVPLVRVMLLQGVLELNFMVAGPFLIREGRDGPILGKGQGQIRWQVKGDEEGFLLSNGRDKYSFSPSSLYLEGLDDGSTFLLFHVLYGHGYFWAGKEDRQYRGHLELLVREGGLMAVNHLNVEEYLYSVVPSEMPALWPLEALKAQSIAARSYTLKRLKGEDYDLCSTVLSAVYSGIRAEHRRSQEAVDATRGQVMTYQGDIIDAVYSSNVGGHTESSADVWGGERAYLQGVSTDISPPQVPLSPGELRYWLMDTPPSFSNHPPYVGHNHYRWVRFIQVEDLEKTFPQLGPIQELRVLSRGRGGSVLSLYLKGGEGQIHLKGDNIRRVFKNLRSNCFVVESVYDEGGELQAFLFYGAGFGHGVGMGQSEAAAMAAKGYHFQEILSFFYQDIKIVKLY